MNKGYEKPKMRFVSLQNNEKIADTCWGYHGTGTTLTRWYYDTEGAGYCTFEISGSNCSCNIANVKYYDSKNDTEPEVLKPGTPQYIEFQAALEKAGGNDGNPFKDGAGFIPDDPSTMS